MFKRMELLLEKWGPYLLALLCAAVILLSALWTRQEDGMRSDAQALSDDSQHLGDVTPSPGPPALLRPAAGGVLQGYSESAVFFPAFGLWRVHPAVDFAAEAGDKIYAMGAGKVTAVFEDGIEMVTEDGFLCRYRGLSQVFVTAGETVRQGACIGTAGGGVPMEGPDRVCVMLKREGQPQDFLQYIDRN